MQVVETLRSPMSTPGITPDLVTAADCLYIDEVSGFVSSPTNLPCNALAMPLLVVKRLFRSGGRNFIASV